MSEVCYVSDSGGDPSECLFAECKRREVETTIPTLELVTPYQYAGFVIYSKEIRRLTIVLSGLASDIFVSIKNHLSSDGVVRAFVLLKLSVEETLKKYVGEKGAALLRGAIIATRRGLATLIDNLQRGFERMLRAMREMSLDSLKSLYRTAGDQVKDALSYLVGLMSHILAKIRNIDLSVVISKVSSAVSMGYSEAKSVLYGSIKYLTQNKLQSILNLSWYTFMGVLAGIYFFIAGLVTKSTVFISRLPQFISFVSSILMLIYSTLSTATYNSVATMLGYEKKEYGKVWSDFTGRYDSFTSINKDAASVSAIFKSVTNLIKFANDKKSLGRFMSRFYYISEIQSGVGIVSGMLSMSDISTSWILVSVIVCFKILSMIFGYILYYGCLDVKCKDYISNTSSSLSPEERVCREKCWNASKINYEFPLDLLSISLDFNSYLINKVSSLKGVSENVRLSYIVRTLNKTNIGEDPMNYVGLQMGKRFSKEMKAKIKAAADMLSDEDMKTLDAAINRKELEQDFTGMYNMVQWYKNTVEMDLSISSLGEVMNGVSSAISSDDDDVVVGNIVDGAVTLMTEVQPTASSSRVGSSTTALVGMMIDSETAKASIGAIPRSVQSIDMSKVDVALPQFTG